jgi:hypothetical protein
MLAYWSLWWMPWLLPWVAPLSVDVKRMRARSTLHIVREGESDAHGSDC